MSQPVDLGRCFYHATDSHLQFALSAIAHFTQSNGHNNTTIPVDVWQWTDHIPVWITEAPELEIHFSVSISPCLEVAASVFISDFVRSVCNFKVWSDLGFAIISKSHRNDTITDECRTHCFTFGLCRATRRPNPTRRRTLPDVLRNPPDAHAPSDVPKTVLASVDIYAEYTYPQWKGNTCKTTQYIIEPLNKLQSPFLFAGRHYPINTEAFAVAAISLSPGEPVMSSVEHNTFFSEHGLEQTLQQYRQTDNTLGAMLRLFDFGLQKLIITTTTKDRQIKVVGEDTLKSLSDLAPAVFNPGYREAMHQRAASIPIISKAFTSMLESSNNPIIRSKASDLLQQSNNLSGGNPLPESDTASLKSTIHSSLWRIAQQNTRRPKVSKGSPIFSIPNPAIPRHFQAQPTSMGLVEEAFFSSSEPPDLDFDNDNTMQHDYIKCPHDDDHLLFESDKESAFEDIYELTPTRLDDTSEWHEPCLLPHSDTEMLHLLFESDNESAFEDIHELTPTRLDSTSEWCEPCLLPHSDTEMPLLDTDILAN